MVTFFVRVVEPEIVVVPVAVGTVIDTVMVIVSAPPEYATLLAPPVLMMLVVVVVVVDVVNAVGEAEALLLRAAIRKGAQSIGTRSRQIRGATYSKDAPFCTGREGKAVVEEA